MGILGSLDTWSLLLRGWPLLGGVQHTQDRHCQGIFGVDYHAVFPDDHFAGAGHATGSVELRMFRQLCHLGLNVVFQLLGRHPGCRQKYNQRLPEDRLGRLPAIEVRARRFLSIKACASLMIC
jgi:hypothetical protein